MHRRQINNQRLNERDISLALDFRHHTVIFFRAAHFFLFSSMHKFSLEKFHTNSIFICVNIKKYLALIKCRTAKIQPIDTQTERREVAIKKIVYINASIH